MSSAAMDVVDIEPVAYLRAGDDGMFHAVFEGVYRNQDALRGIEGFEYLWLLWGPDGDECANGLELTCVSFAGTAKTREHGMVLRVSGEGLVDGAPIYDVKPYIAYTDSHPHVR